MKKSTYLEKSVEFFIFKELIYLSFLSCCYCVRVMGVVKGGKGRREEWQGGRRERERRLGRKQDYGKKRRRKNMNEKNGGKKKK